MKKIAKGLVVMILTCLVLSVVVPHIFMTAALGLFVLFCLTCALGRVEFKVLR